MTARRGNKALRKMNRGRRWVAGRRLRELRICATKVGWPTEAQAEDALFTILEQGDIPKRPVQTYLCPVCGKWHLTSRTRA